MSSESHSLDSMSGRLHRLRGTSGLAASNRRFRLTQLSLALAAGFSSLVLANPLDPTVIAGSAAFQNTGNALTITNTNGTVINWKGFSIGQGEITRFIQTDAASQVLNRVTSGVPSEILGSLQSNGRVFLINQNGIAFGPNAQVDVGGLVVSSLGLSNADFLAGRLNFTGQAGAGGIVNQGVIRTASGGMVALIAPNIENTGVIEAPNGDVILAAGKSANLVDLQRPEIQVEINAADNQALNVGQLIGRSIGIYAGAIKHSGIASANTAARDEQGRVVFKAAGDTLVSGSISARNEAGQGGHIEVLGNRIGLLAGTELDASGKTGGGAVLVGGDFQGKNPEVQNSRQTYVASTARISADAIENGDGGKVVVWADGRTEYRGSISAKGGALGGDGGNVEVSGKDQLILSGKVDTSASKGRVGTLLLDPTDVDIVTGGTEDLVGTANNDSNANTFAFSESDGVSPSNIDPLTIVGLLNSNDVTIQATNNITVSNAIDASANTGSKGLTLTANNSILLNADITLKQGATSFLTLTADADASGAGTITVGGTRTVTVLDGAINFAGITEGVAGTPAGLTLNAGTGTINMAAIYGAGALPDATGLTDVTITNAGTTNFNGPIAITGALTQTNAATGTTTFADTVSVGSAALTGTAFNLNNSFTSGGTTAFTNSGVLTKSATGAITSTGAFSTTGDVSLANNITTTNSDLTIGGNLVIAEAATPTLSTGAGAGNILVSGTTNGTAGGAVESLTVLAGAGNVSFGGAVGSGTRLGAITISSAADLDFAGSVSAVSLTQTAGTGTTALNGTVNTNGAGGVSLIGSNLVVNGAVATTGGGAVTFNELGTVTTTAAGDISSGAAVTVSGGGPLSAAGDISGTTVSLVGVGLTNTGTITGTTALTVDAGTGTLNNSGGTISNGGAGSTVPVLLKGDSMVLAGGTITGHAAPVTLTSGTAGRTISLGAGTGLLLTQAELDVPTTTGGLTVGDPGHTGDIVIGGTIGPLAGASGGFTVNNGYDLSGGPVTGRIQDSGAGLINVADNVMLKAYGDIGDAVTPVHIGSNAISLITSSEAGNAFTYIGKIGALVLSGVNSPGGQVFYTATGPITQNGAIVAGALHATVSGTGGITLQDNLNTVTNLYLEAPGALTYHQDAAYTVVEAKGGSMDFSSAGNLSLAPVTGSGPLNIDAGTGDVLLSTTGVASTISITGSGKVVAGNLKLTSANAVNFSGGSNTLNPGVSNDLSIKTSGNLEVNAVSMKVTGGTAIAGLGQTLKNDVVIETGGVLTIKTTGDLTLNGGTATTSDSTAQAQANAFVTADKLDLKVGGNFYINGGTANLAGGQANVSSIVFVKSGKAFDVTGDFVLTGGAITGTGTKATALAVFDPELTLEIKTGGSVAVVGGTSPSSSANLLASASIQNAGPINFTIDGAGNFVHPDAVVAALLGTGIKAGLIVAGGKGSGLYDALDNPVTGNFYPITYSFTHGGALTVITDLTNHSVALVKSRTAIGVDESLMGYINFSINTETIAQSRRGATDQGNYRRKIAGQCS